MKKYINYEFIANCQEVGVKTSPHQTQSSNFLEAANRKLLETTGSLTEDRLKMFLYI